MRATLRFWYSATGGSWSFAKDGMLSRDIVVIIKMGMGLSDYQFKSCATWLCIINRSPGVMSIIRNYICGVVNGSA